MPGKKGMKHYPKEIRNEIVSNHDRGRSVSSLSKEYGVSRGAIQCWCGLRQEYNIKQMTPLRRGRPRKKRITTERELELENKQLKMENDLQRSFLQVAGRK